MYRLMKSEKCVPGYLASGLISIYRQIEVAEYQYAGTAMRACDVANEITDNPRHYVLNDAGKEFFGGNWID